MTAFHFLPLKLYLTENDGKDTADIKENGMSMKVKSQIYNPNIANMFMCCTSFTPIQVHACWLYVIYNVIYNLAVEEIFRFVKYK